MPQAPKICYWCGAPSTGREHVPPRNLFPDPVGDGELYPITVPSCDAHNEDMSDLDERFRVYLQGISQSEIAATLFRDKTLRGLKERPGLLAALRTAAQPATLNGEPSHTISLDKQEVRTYFEKVVRGLYFHHHSEPFPGTFVSSCSHISVTGSDFRRAILMYHDYSHALELGTSAHPDIFRYYHARVVEPAGIGTVFRLTIYGDITVFAIGTHETPD